MATDERDEFLEMFFVEAADHVATLEAGLLSLEQKPGDEELLNALFRAAHSIKGASGMLGFDTLCALTHALEGVLDAQRGNTLAGTPEVASLLLESTDLVRGCLDAARGAQPGPDIGSVVARLEGLISAPHATATPTAPPTAPAATHATAPEPAPGSGERRVVVHFRPGRDTFLTGLDPALCVRELAELGTLKVEALLDGVPPLQELDAEACHVGWKLELHTAAPLERIEGAFAFIDAPVELRIEDPAAARPAASAAPATPQEESSREPQPAAATPTPAASARRDEGSLRVNTTKIDRLVNLVGELVIAQAMVTRSLATFTPAELPRLRETALEMERHTRALQDGVMNIRMVPIGTIFGRFRRLMRDLSESLGKDIALDTVGEETELDKSVVEALADPLMHLVRNSADHGLEGGDERMAMGKPRTGTVKLSARHQGGNVVVEVSDDGRGLDTERIRQRALERGLIAAGATPSDDVVHRLIFAPGFSTAAKVTDLSGRGVGMDVVLRSVEALNGKVTIFTERGRGTRIRVSLPLTLAIIDGMSLRVGTSTFVVPLNHVVETVPLQRCTVRKLPSGASVLSVRGRNLPLLHLSQLLGCAHDEGNPRPLVVIVECAESPFAFVIDELVGKSQLVIKALEANYRRVEGVLGATILGDGTVSFILDVQGLAALGGLTTTTEARAA
jgi:two-component system chemotaxis sensor kinase CheA